MPQAIHPEFRDIDFLPADPEEAFQHRRNSHIPSAIGMIVSHDQILTFDDGLDANSNKRAVLPEATIVYPATVEQTTSAILERFNIHAIGRIVGSTAWMAKSISKKQTPRIFVPVAYEHPQPRTPDYADMPYALRNSVFVWRSPEEILDILDFDDRAQPYGSQRRGITRAAIQAYLNDPAS